MNIKIDGSVTEKEKVTGMLEKGGFTISDEAALMISENSSFIKVINEREDTILLPSNEIVSVESLAKDNYIYTKDKEYLVRNTLDNLSDILGTEFLRISRNTIIRKNSIKKISPSFQMKYKLVLINGRVTYVTRNYYYFFKEYYGL